MNIRNLSLALIALSSLAADASAAGRLGPGDIQDQTVRRLRGGDGGTPIVYVLREKAQVMFDGIANGDSRLMIFGPGGQLAGKLDLKAGKKKSIALDLDAGGYILVLRALHSRGALARIEYKPIVDPLAPSAPRIPSVAARIQSADGGSMEISQGPQANQMKKDGKKENDGKLSKSQGATKSSKLPKQEKAPSAGKMNKS